MNNKYWKNGCPALMSDARFTTQYINSNVLNQQIRNLNKINTSHEYRSFLQKNASTIINNERNALYKQYTCNIQNRTNNSCGC